MIPISARPSWLAIMVPITIQLYIKKTYWKHFCVCMSAINAKCNKFQRMVLSVCRVSRHCSRCFPAGNAIDLQRISLFFANEPSFSVRAVLRSRNQTGREMDYYLASACTGQFICSTLKSVYQTAFMLFKSSHTHYLLFFFPFFVLFC